MPLRLSERSFLSHHLNIVADALSVSARDRVKASLDILGAALDPTDKRYAPSQESAERRVMIATSARERELFKAEEIITRQTVSIVGWANLSRELNMTEGSLRVRLCRGRSYLARRPGLADGVLITRVNARADEPDTSGECRLDYLRHVSDRLGFPGLRPIPLKKVLARQALQHLRPGAKVPSQDAPVAAEPPAPDPRPRRRR